jgi:hypothetical protein
VGLSRCDCIAIDLSGPHFGRRAHDATGLSQSDVILPSTTGQAGIHNDRLVSLVDYGLGRLQVSEYDPLKMGFV